MEPSTTATTQEDSPESEAPQDSELPIDTPGSAGADSEPEPNKSVTPLWLILILGPFLVLFFVLMCAALAITVVAPAVLGWQLRNRRRYDLAVVAAALSCSYIPFGTILGGWALMVLTREPARALFADRASVPVSEDDVLYLKLLSRFHYVAAVINGLTCVYPLFFMGFALVAIFGPPQKDPIPDPVIWLFVVFGTVFLLWLLAVAICTWRAGHYLKEHRRRIFCLVVAVVNCIAGPYGTVLGVFTILVLSRPSVQLLFESPPAEPLPVAPAPP